MRARGGRSRGAVARAVPALLASVIVAACGASGDVLVLASTTSTEDSGLFEALIPAFAAAHPGIQVRVVAVGSGEALAYGRRRDADVLLVHAPFAEAQFMDAGHGEARHDVMYNDYVIVGPPTNPAGLTPLMRTTEAFRRIAAAGGPFVSRGDSSGTHLKEVALWELAGVAPDPRWHLEIGQGMAAALQVASERGAYTLTDRSTFLTHMRATLLGILHESDDVLYNPYGVIVVAGAPNIEAARLFAAWITGPGQQVIGDFGRERIGQSLFMPSALPTPSAR